LARTSAKSIGDDERAQLEAAAAVARFRRTQLGPAVVTMAAAEALDV
jgi:hypothetical protein